MKHPRPIDHLAPSALKGQPQVLPAQQMMETLAYYRGDVPGTQNGTTLRVLDRRGRESLFNAHLYPAGRGHWGIRLRPMR